MSGLKTLIRTALCLTLVLRAATGLAETPLDAEYFAVCTGRLSALMEHQFLTDGPASDATRQQRDAMADILDAMADPVADPVAARHLMGLRVDAKWAYRALLAQAAFGPDPDGRAAKQAALMGRSCTALLLG